MPQAQHGEEGWLVHRRGDPHAAAVHRHSRTLQNSTDRVPGAHAAGRVFRPLQGAGLLQTQSRGAHHEDGGDVHHEARAVGAGPHQAADEARAAQLRLGRPLQGAAKGCLDGAAVYARLVAEALVPANEVHPRLHPPSNSGSHQGPAHGGFGDDGHGDAHEGGPPSREGGGTEAGGALGGRGEGGGDASVSHGDQRHGPAQGGHGVRAGDAVRERRAGGGAGAPEEDGAGAAHPQPAHPGHLRAHHRRPASGGGDGDGGEHGGDGGGEAGQDHSAPARKGGGAQGAVRASGGGGQPGGD
mmetsp:Transcript_17681/g.33809  ORF Transcript_17681/g.33809 Transcript_17681/m.33809 type:complete len:299 (-) Transcript_17681:1906-2802(-)